jgi:pimeloyl-ACP methyl ester carboxylesterase
VSGSVLQRRYPSPGPLVWAGDHRLMLYCAGGSGPTVVIEPGMGQDWTGWGQVWQRLSPVARVCVYDRAGYGWSDAGPRPRTASASAGDLHALLIQARVPGPYILVAHSFGAYIARIYASRYPESVAGVVLLDPSHEDENPPAPAAQSRGLRLSDLTGLIPPLGIERLKRLYRGPAAAPPRFRDAPAAFVNRYLIASSIEQLRSERSEFESAALTLAQARSAPFPPDVPLIVITAMHLRPTGGAAAAGPEFPPLHREVQGRLAAESRYGRQIIAAQSGHFIYSNEPALVVDAILTGIQQSRQQR